MDERGRPAMIYHHAMRLERENAGSQVHLAQMLAAFGQIGYDTELLAGVAAARRPIQARLMAEARAGRRFDFAYTWSPTIPTLAVKRNLLRPFLDAAFFRWCKAQGIPIGLFYGDVHWRLPELGMDRKPLPQRTWLYALYWYDWLVYRRFVDHLFLPALSMQTALPTRWPAGRVSALLPGCNVVDLPVSPRAAGEPLRVFYVGGVTPPLYDIRPMVDAVRSLDGVRLTVCCRPAEWAAVAAGYGPVDGERIRVVHAYGEELKRYYAEADVFGWFHLPYRYLQLTMPVKVFEALGYGLPMISTGGTEAAAFIAREDTGWVVDTTEEFCRLLVDLRDHPEALARKSDRVRAMRAHQTWAIRARQIAGTLRRAA